MRWYFRFLSDKTHRVFGALAWWLNERKLRNCNFTWGDKANTDVGEFVRDVLESKACKIRTVEDLLYVLMEYMRVDFLWSSLFVKIKDHKERRIDVIVDINKALNQFLKFMAKRGIIEYGDAMWSEDRIEVYIKYRNWWVRGIMIYLEITKEGIKPRFRWVCHDIGVKYYNGVGEFC